MSTNHRLLLPVFVLVLAVCVTCIGLSTRADNKRESANPKLVLPIEDLAR